MHCFKPVLRTQTWAIKLHSDQIHNTQCTNFLRDIVDLVNY